MRKWALIGGVTALLLAFGGTGVVRAQDWTVSVDTLIGSQFFIKAKTGSDNNNSGNGKATLQDLPKNGQDGFILSVTSPYHVGLALEDYTIHLTPFAPADKTVLNFKAQMLDAFADFPVWRWITISPGVGWGTAKLTIESSSAEINGGGFERNINLWQYYVVVGFHITSSIQARLGYHLAYGELPSPQDQNNGSTGPTTYKYQPLQVRLTTLGVGYTF